MDERTTWRKSTFSGSESNCVELPGTLDGVRDSKNVAGPVLRLDVTALVAAAKAGTYDA
ncbi:MAG TPA: DUF397 domain-containing protein [Pseudonocardiaceae bacterium]|jgi:hypothetical protein